MSGVHVFPLLLGSGFRASLPVGLAWAATRLAPRSSAATRHFIWACAIAGALFLPIATIATPRWNVAAPAPLERLASTARSETAPVTVPSVTTIERIGMDATHKPDDRWLGGLAPWTIATWIWMTGAIVVSCYVLIGHFTAWRFYRTTRSIQSYWVQEAQQLAKELGFNRTLRIVESDRVSIPIVLHLWQPIIIMPAAATQWPWICARAALLHELAHIKRNDLHMQSLAQLACSVYWFNPLVWFAAHQLRVERERACDDFVLLYGTSGADYATHLFEIARAGSRSTVRSFAIGMAVHTSQLEQRLVAIVNPRIPRQPTTIPGRFIVAVPMLFVALAAGAVQITTRAIEVPLGAIRLPTAAIEVRADAAERLTAATRAKLRSVPTVSNAESISPPEKFHWAGTMHEHQTVEVHLGRGSIQVLPSRDDTVHVEARTDNPSHSEIQAVSTRNGVKFCNIVTRARESRNYCEPRQGTSRIQGDQPATEFVIYVPARLHFSGSTEFGDITDEHPAANTDLAIIDGNITLELAAEEGANFNGNVIEGAIRSDFPLDDNTPTLPGGERMAVKAPRIVHAILGAGGPHLSAMVVNGNIRLLRRSSE